MEAAINFFNQSENRPVSPEDNYALYPDFRQGIGPAWDIGSMLHAQHSRPSVTPTHTYTHPLHSQMGDA